jgi:hypothetical protein
MKKLKSMEGLKKQLNNIESLKNCDKHMLNNSYSIKDMNLFLSNNFDLIENNHNEIFVDISEKILNFS